MLCGHYVLYQCNHAHRKYKYNSAILQHWVEKEWCGTTSMLSKQGASKTALGHGDANGALPDTSGFIDEMDVENDSGGQAEEMREEAHMFQ